MPYVTSKGVRLFWEEQGRGTPLLLVMGHRFSSALWYPARDALAARHRVISFDNRGTGRSGSASGFSIADMADDALAVLDAAGVDRAHLYGVSMGGVIVQDVAIRRPDRVLSLVVGCSGMLTADKPRARAIVRALYYVPPGLLRRLFRGRPHDYGSAAPAELVAHDRRAIDRDPMSMRGVRAQATAIRRHLVSAEQVRALAMPALVLHGDEDRTVPHAFGVELAETIPDARFVSLPGAGHNYLVARGETANAAVLAFLDRVDGRSKPPAARAADPGLSRALLHRLPSGVAAPGFDVAKVTPGIVHLGFGGFHRAHMARFTHDVMALDPAALGWGIVGVGLRPADRPLIDAIAAQDNLYTLVESDADSRRATVIGAIAGVIDASATTRPALDAIDAPAIRIVSLTVTEHGYCLDRATKTLDLGHPGIVHDRLHPGDPRTAIGVLVQAYARRRAAGRPAFTALSCDNIEHNGDVLRAAVLTLARAHDPALAAWIDRSASFPGTMVDRITPVPSPEQTLDLRTRLGIADRAPLVAEPFRQWVIEDRFVGGRPAWERAGAQFVDDVAPYEFMKLRLLNTSHLVVAGLGQLAGHGTIHEAVAQPLIGRTMRALMDRETGPTLRPVPGVDLAAYKDALLRRFANPAIRDTTARVNADAPLNLLLDPIRDRLAANAPIDLLALGLAAWLRRVRGEDGAGRPIAVIHPLAERLRDRAIAGGEDPGPLLAIGELFGDLGHAPRLREDVGRWLSRLYRAGVAATLDEAALSGLI